jgi:hypothetical protein
LILMNILQFADFIRLLEHRNQLRFPDKFWSVENELGFTHTEPHMPIFRLDCFSWDRFHCGHTETNVSFDYAHKQIPDFSDKRILQFAVFIKYPTNINYRYAPNNDVSVKNGPHIRLLSHEIIRF